MMNGKDVNYNNRERLQIYGARIGQLEEELALVYNTLMETLKHKAGLLEAAQGAAAVLANYWPIHDGELEVLRAAIMLASESEMNDGQVE